MLLVSQKCLIVEWSILGDIVFLLFINKDYITPFREQFLT